MFSKILCTLDGSDHARKALALAVEMAKTYDASLVLLHVLLRNADAAALRHFAEIEGFADTIEPEVKRLEELGNRVQVHLIPAYENTTISTRPLIDIGQHILDDAKFTAADKGVKNIDSVLLDGDPADQILRCIDERKIDCVVMGSRGLGEVKSLLLGSVSHKVMNRAPCTCIAVK